jgi:hypothetical protein
MVSDILYEYLSLASFMRKQSGTVPQRIQPIQLTESLMKSVRKLRIQSSILFYLPSVSLLHVILIHMVVVNIQSGNKWTFIYYLFIY